MVTAMNVVVFSVCDDCETIDLTSNWSGYCWIFEMQMKNNELRTFFFSFFRFVSYFFISTLFASRLSFVDNVKPFITRTSSVT